MNHTDHVNLLRRGIARAGGVWADMGAGSGAFTLALAELIGATGTIYAVDKDASVLRQLARAVQTQYPTVTLHCISGDFTQTLDLPLLDGMVMANSLHFVRHKDPVVRRVRGYLKPGGRLLMVEYNADDGNTWVPYPLSFQSWVKLAAACGFAHTTLLATHPSRFMDEIYAAASFDGER